jgi:hypothetical protein
MKRLAMSALVALSLFASVSAFADKGNKPNFPMPAAEFQQRVDARLAKGRAHMEEHIKKANLDATKAKEKRDAFDARAAKVQAAAKLATADGTVTADEAKAVREAGGGHKGGHKHAKK